MVGVGGVVKMHIPDILGPERRPVQGSAWQDEALARDGVPEQLERPAGFPSSDKTRPDSPVPTLHPLEVRPSSVAPDPAESREALPTPQDPSPLRGTLGSSLTSS